MLRRPRRQYLIASALAALSLLAACGSARVVQRTPTGGVIELDGERANAMERAHQAMAANCAPRGYAIVKEGKEGVEPDAAWRLHYQCGGRPVPPDSTPIQEPEPPPTAR